MDVLDNEPKKCIVLSLYVSVVVGTNKILYFKFYLSIIIVKKYYMTVADINSCFY